MRSLNGVWVEHRNPGLWWALSFPVGLSTASRRIAELLGENHRHPRSTRTSAQSFAEIPHGHGSLRRPGPAHGVEDLDGKSAYYVSSDRRIRPARTFVRDEMKLASMYP